MDGLGAPGYVKVHFDIFMIALVLDRIPNKIEGGGKENLTDVAESV